MFERPLDATLSTRPGPLRLRAQSRTGTCSWAPRSPSSRPASSSGGSRSPGASWCVARGRVIVTHPESARRTPCALLARLTHVHAGVPDPLLLLRVLHVPVHLHRLATVRSGVEDDEHGPWTRTRTWRRAQTVRRFPCGPTTLLRSHPSGQTPLPDIFHDHFETVRGGSRDAEQDRGARARSFPRKRPSLLLGSRTR